LAYVTTDRRFADPQDEDSLNRLAIQQVQASGKQVREGYLLILKNDYWGLVKIWNARLSRFQ
jgi:hypothetical protein